MAAETLLRPAKLGLAGWFAGLFGSMLVSLLVVGGIAGAVTASLPGAVAVYVNAHGFLVYSLATGEGTVGGGTTPIALVPTVCWSLLPLLVLLGVGAVLADGAGTLGVAVRRGASVVLGYGTGTVVSFLWLLHLSARLGGGVTDFFEGALLLRFAVAGLLAPIVLGGLGGTLRWRLTGRRPAA